MINSHDINSVRVRDVIDAVSRVSLITPEAIMSRSRLRRIVEARHCVCVIARQEANRSYPAIGRVLDRDHTTILHATRVWFGKCERKPALREMQRRAEVLLPQIVERRRLATAALSIQHSSAPSTAA